MRSRIMRLVMFITFLFYCNSMANAQQREFTHSDLADGIVMISKDIRENLARLERHELRERQLGEHLKKALAAIDKRLKAQDTEFDNVKSTLNQVQVTLQQRDERERIQLHRVLEAVEAVRSSVELAIRSGTLGGGGGSSNDSELRALRERIEQLQQQATPGTDLVLASEKLREAASNLVTGEGHWRKHGEESARLVTDLRNAIEKLQSIQTKEPTPEDEGDGPHLGAILDSLEATQRILTDTASNLERDVRQQSLSTVDSKNATLYAIASLREDVIRTADRTQDNLFEEIRSARDVISQGQTKTNDIMAHVHTDSAATLEAVRGVEKVIIQTADGILDTKRRVEYGVTQIIFENSEIVTAKSKELNTAFNTRFDLLAATILSNQTQSLTNLSARMEGEISQVWRQIGIMYRELSQSAGTLDRLQSQTESYVNGSLTTMDNMSGKVGLLSNRMSEVDSNLNYLLGRLSLISQEFNMIKSGLSDALNRARQDFAALQSDLELTASKKGHDDESESDNSATDVKHPIHDPVDDNRILTSEE